MIDFLRNNSNINYFKNKARVKSNIIVNYKKELDYFNDKLGNKDKNPFSPLLEIAPFKDHNRNLTPRRRTHSELKGVLSKSDSKDKKPKAIK